MYKLTDRVAVFVEKVTQGALPADAAKLAGYNHPAQYAVALMKKPHVVKAILENQKRWFFGTGLVLARKALENLLNDDEVPHGVRFNAARYVIDKAGELNRDDDLNAMLDKAVEDMSVEELEIFVKEGRAVLRGTTGTQPGMHRKDRPIKALADQEVIEVEQDIFS